MRKIYLLSIVCLFLFGCKNEYKEEIEILQKYIWVNISQNVDIWNGEKTVHEKVEILDEEKTIHIFDKSNILFKYNSKGELINTYTYEVVKDGLKIDYIIVHERLEDTKFRTMIVNGYMQLIEIKGANVYWNNFIPIEQDSILKNLKLKE